MLLPLTFLAVFILAILAYNVANYEGEVFFGFVGLVSVAALFFSLIAIPLNRMDVAANLRAGDAIRETRMIPETVHTESAAFRLKVAEYNVFLAKSKYYAESPWFSAYFPAEILTAEPIK